MASTCTWGTTRSRSNRECLRRRSARKAVTRQPPSKASGPRCRKLPRLDARRVRLLRRRNVPHGHREGVRSDRQSHRAVAVLHTRVPPDRRDRFRIDGRSLRPEASADVEPRVLLGDVIRDGAHQHLHVVPRLRALFGIGMGGEWGVGASLAMEKAPSNRRGLFSGLLQEGYACGYLLARCVIGSCFRGGDGVRCSSSADSRRSSRCTSARR
jgi:hypothetical protein